MSFYSPSFTIFSSFLSFLFNFSFFLFTFPFQLHLFFRSPFLFINKSTTIFEFSTTSIIVSIRVGIFLGTPCGASYSKMAIKASCPSIFLFKFMITIFILSIDCCKDLIMNVVFYLSSGLFNLFLMEIVKQLTQTKSFKYSKQYRIHYHQ